MDFPRDRPPKWRGSIIIAVTVLGGVLVQNGTRHQSIHGESMVGGGAMIREVRGSGTLVPEEIR